MASPPNLPATIIRLAHAAYPSMAMLAGMQLDVFTPLKDGPLPCQAIAEAIGVKPEKLGPLLYALAQAGLLTVEGGAFANTQEADHFLVRGRPAYMGSAHELFADLWAAALGVARSIRAGAPHAKHDFAAMPDEEFGGFFRGLHPSALATGRQLAATEASPASGTSSTWAAGRAGLPSGPARSGRRSGRRWPSCRGSRQSPGPSWPRRGSPTGSRSSTSTSPSGRRRTGSTRRCCAT